jgi:hypothetical protein
MVYQRGDLVRFTRSQDRHNDTLGVIVEIYPDKSNIRVYWFKYEFIGVCFRGDISPALVEGQKN